MKVFFFTSNCSKHISISLNTFDRKISQILESTRLCTWMLISLCDVDMTAKFQYDRKLLSSDFVLRFVRSCGKTSMLGWDDPLLIENSAGLILHDQHVSKFIHHRIHQGRISQTVFKFSIQNFWWDFSIRMNHSGHIFRHMACATRRPGDIIIFHSSFDYELINRQ